MDQKEDPRCIKQKSSFCEDDAECVEKVGDGYVCGPEGYCTLTCEKDDDCDNMGEGHICGEDSGRKTCYKWCYDDSSCAFFGYNWHCLLPEGVGQKENFFAQAADTVTGRCGLSETGIDWGSYAPAAGAATVAGATTATGALTAAVPCPVLVAPVPTGSSGTISRATMLMILISGLTAGPAVSL